MYTISCLVYPLRLIVERMEVHSVHIVNTRLRNHVDHLVPTIFMLLYIHNIYVIIYTLIYYHNISALWLFSVCIQNVFRYEEWRKLYLFRTGLLKFSVHDVPNSGYLFEVGVHDFYKWFAPFRISTYDIKIERIILNWCPHV